MHQQQGLWSEVLRVFTVQLNEGEVSFVCAADNPKNTAKYFIGKCENPVFGGGPGDVCDGVEGQSCPGAAGCLLDQGNGNLEALNSRCHEECDRMGGDAMQIEGPTVGYNEGMEQIGCKN
jgi:hypothetical protein